MPIKYDNKNPNGEPEKAITEMAKLKPVPLRTCRICGEQKAADLFGKGGLYYNVCDKCKPKVAEEQKRKQQKAQYGARQCRVCGELKQPEKFGTQGEARFICLECQKARAELIRGTAMTKDKKLRTLEKLMREAIDAGLDVEVIVR